MMLRKIRPLWFFAAFAFGLLVCYILTPPPELVMKFPSPSNAGKVTYRDKEDNCFAFQAQPVACPSGSDPAAAANVRLQPISA